MSRHAGFTQQNSYDSVQGQHQGHDTYSNFGKSNTDEADDKNIKSHLTNTLYQIPKSCGR